MRTMVLTKSVGSIILASLLFMAVPVTGHAGTQIAYIFATGNSYDSTTAIGYKTLLDSAGYSTTLISDYKILSTSFAPFGAIIIGSSSGAWPDSFKAAALNNPGRAIVGMGIGGAYYFERLKLKIGHGNTASDAIDTLIVADTSSSLVKTPNALPMISGKRTILFTAKTSSSVWYLPYVGPPAISPVRSKNDTSYGFITILSPHYIAWGGTHATDVMTIAGKALFLNVVDYAVKKLTSVRTERKEIPSEFVLQQNYPNPFNPSTTIGFTLPAAAGGQVSGLTTLKIYDALGREVSTLVNENLEAGVYHERTFNASNLASGIYFAKLTSGGVSQMKKMSLIK